MRSGKMEKKEVAKVTDERARAEAQAQIESGEYSETVPALWGWYLLGEAECASFYLDTADPVAEAAAEIAFDGGDEVVTEEGGNYIVTEMVTGGYLYTVRAVNGEPYILEVAHAPKPVGAPITTVTDNAPVTVLAKDYPGSGRPAAFQIVKDDDKEEIERLVEDYGYYVLDTGIQAGVDPWERYTHDDAGLAQWGQEAI